MKKGKKVMLQIERTEDGKIIKTVNHYIKKWEREQIVIDMRGINSEEKKTKGNKRAEKKKKRTQGKCFNGTKKAT